jgi:ATP-dependent exoDNAse (exonuclease V) beta subunit
VYRVYDKEGQQLKYKPISVTTLIHKYQKPFDLEGMSAMVAAREGVTQQEIKDRWANISKKACKHGTRMHSVAERIFNGEFVDDSTFTPEQQVIFKQIETVVKRMKERPYDYESEKIIFDPVINVAGTVDLIGKNRETGEYVMMDWKTNKRIRKENEYGDTFLSPIDDLQDCEFNLYGLQLAMYEHILREGGFIEPDAKMRKFICHFNADTGCQFHEVDSSFTGFKDKLVADWKKRQEALAEMNIDIPQF